MHNIFFVRRLLADAGEEMLTGREIAFLARERCRKNPVIIKTGSVVGGETGSVTMSAWRQIQSAIMVLREDEDIIVLGRNEYSLIAPAHLLVKWATAPFSLMSPGDVGVVELYDGKIALTARYLGRIEG